MWVKARVSYRPTTLCNIRQAPASTLSTSSCHVFSSSSHNIYLAKNCQSTGIAVRGTGGKIDKTYFHSHQTLSDSAPKLVHKQPRQQSTSEELTFLDHTNQHSSSDPATISKLKLDKNGKMLHLVWSNGHCSSFSAEWIRQHDRSPASYNATANQRQANRALTTPDPTLGEVWLENNAIHFTTIEDKFGGFLPAEFLAEVDWLRRESQRDNRRRTVRAEQLQSVPLPFDLTTTIERNQLLKFQSTVCAALLRDGACVVRTNATHLGFVANLVDKALGLTVMRTVYGTTFQVRVEPKPDNLAYTSSALHLHQDLPYYESPPGLQLLHCLQNSVSGGQLVLADGIFVAERMREQYPDKFAVLTRVPVLFQKIYGKISGGVSAAAMPQEYAAHIRRYQPMIMTNWRGDVVDVRFNVITDGPMIMPLEDEKPFLDAYRTFYQMLSNEEWQLRWSYEPGDVVIFNNRLMTHARTAFDAASGMRHLEGCYVNIDEFRSHAICLHKAGILDSEAGAEGERFIEPRTCNGDWL